VITGIARAGIDALIELAAEKTPRGRTGRLCENPQVQDAVGRADAILNAGRTYRSATITELWNTVAAGEDTTLEQRARCRLAAVYAADSAREAMDLMYRHGGAHRTGVRAAWPSAGVISTSLARRSRSCRSGTRWAAGSC